MKSRNTKVITEGEPPSEFEGSLEGELEETICADQESEDGGEEPDGAAIPAYSFKECFQALPEAVRELLSLSYKNADKFGWLRAWKVRNGDWHEVGRELKDSLPPEAIAKIEQFWAEQRVKYLELVYVAIPNLADCIAALAAELSHHAFTAEWTEEISDVLLSDPVRFWWLALEGGNPDWSAVLEVLQYEKTLELNRPPSEQHLESLWETEGRPAVRQALEQLWEIIPGNYDQ